MKPTSFTSALHYADRFFMGTAESQLAAKRIAAELAKMEIPYALAGGLAIAAHGYLRVTTDVDVILTEQGLRAFKERWLGRGWVERFEGSRGMRDTLHDVPIDVSWSGGLDLTEAAESVDGIQVLRLPVLIELKLASGQSAPHRLRDLADVIELIRIQALPEDYAEQLDPSVRDGYLDLWHRAQVDDPPQ